ncbi:hypothetical protein ACFXDJ_13495 [Streptomyces sp. NPDC059443]|uniref:hypothetical protein n=1 Tax=unclassified Streptomyces TaxID=2593676 RepID=UPI0036BF344F
MTKANPGGALHGLTLAHAAPDVEEDRPEPVRTPRPIAAIVLATSAAVVAVWGVMILFYAEPDRRLLWGGFDLMMAALMALASRLAARRDPRVSLAAAGLAVFMVNDLWFDVLTAPSEYLPMSLLTAFTLELPYAVACVVYALRVHRRAVCRPVAP